MHEGSLASILVGVAKVYVVHTVRRGEDPSRGTRSPPSPRHRLFSWRTVERSRIDSDLDRDKNFDCYDRGDLVFLLNTPFHLAVNPPTHITCLGYPCSRDPRQSVQVQYGLPTQSCSPCLRQREEEGGVAAAGGVAAGGGVAAAGGVATSKQISNSAGLSMALLGHTDLSQIFIFQYGKHLFIAD